MKLTVLASVVAAASAFAPTQQASSSTALKAFEDELGAQPPLGFFDPLNLVADGDQEKVCQNNSPRHWDRGVLHYPCVYCNGPKLISSCIFLHQSSTVFVTLS